MKKASPEPSPNRRSWASIMLRMASAHGAMEATINSFMSAGALDRRKRGSASIVRTTQSVAERTSGRSVANFCCGLIWLSARG